MSDADRAPVAVSTEAASTDRPHHGPGRERTLSGWGRVALSRAEVVEVRDADEVATVLAARHVGDVRLRRDLIAAMYPELHRFHAQRALVDPDRVLRSDLGRRLGLCATAS